MIYNILTGLGIGALIIYAVSNLRHRKKQEVLYKQKKGKDHDTRFRL